MVIFFHNTAKMGNFARLICEVVSKFKELFSMTKSERIGSIVVLAVLVLALLSGWLIRRCDRTNTADEARMNERVAEFAAEIDSLWTPAVEESAKASDAKKHERGDKKHSKATSKKKTKQSAGGEQRHVEPVPNLADDSH